MQHPLLIVSTRKSAVMEIRQLDVERGSCCLDRAPWADFTSDNSLPFPLALPGFLTWNIWIISKNILSIFSTVFVNLLNLLALLLDFMCKHTQNCVINYGRLNFWLDCFVGLSWLEVFSNLRCFFCFLPPHLCLKFLSAIKRIYMPLNELYISHCNI